MIFIYFLINKIIHLIKCLFNNFKFNNIFVNKFLQFTYNLRHMKKKLLKNIQTDIKIIEKNE